MAEELTYSRVTSSSLRAATGRDWEGWLELLDGEGARGLDHKGLVALVEAGHPEVTSGWWRQCLAVGYAQARGQRHVGETADAGFQVGVRRTLAAEPAVIWDLLVGRPELWLGEGAHVRLESGVPWKAAAASGQVRTVRPGDRVRLTWLPDGWPAPATLQLTVAPTTDGRTTLGVHLERLADAEAREAAREHWRSVLDRLQEEISRGTAP
jgi:uncharacterized protein YndB with AHSA1/START domain